MTRENPEIFELMSTAKISGFSRHRYTSKKAMKSALSQQLPVVDIVTLV